MKIFHKVRPLCCVLYLDTSSKRLIVGYETSIILDLVVSQTSALLFNEFTSLNSAVSDNKHELIQVALLLHITMHKNIEKLVKHTSPT